MQGFSTLTDAEYARIQEMARKAVQTSDFDLMADVAAALAEHGITLDHMVAACKA